jgi:hypothetical protein
MAERHLTSMKQWLSFFSGWLFVWFGSSHVAASDLVVHEWGTFTSVVGSDGKMLVGLELEEERVPNFVHSIAGFAPWNKGWSRPVAGVTVKMETPVLYFYSTELLHARVEVGFNGGSISQWYPERHSGETLPPPPVRFTDRGQPIGAPPVLDFAAGYSGHAAWEVDVLAPGPAADAKITTPRQLETAQWPRARVPHANLVRSANGETEGFIFYRGIGRLSLPLHVSCTAECAITLRNTGSAELPFIWVYEREPQTGAVRSWFGQLGGDASAVASVLRGSEASDRERFHAALVAAGLTRDEARALIATWRESYFDRPGLRVFWIVPREMTDAILPIVITPRPAKLERVLVGRTEVLTPAFERELRRDFAIDGGKRWENDRYVRAYRDRVQRLSGMVGVAPTRRTP